MEVNDTVPVILPKERTNIEITTPVIEKNRFSFMEKYFFSGDTGPITPNHCPGSRLNTSETPRYQYKSNKNNGNNKYHLTREIMLREHGLSAGEQCSLIDSTSSSFQNRFYGSHHVVEKLKLLHSIHHGQKYVTYKALDFNRAGSLLCSNSSRYEPTTVKVWDWGLNKLKFSYEAGHTRGAQITDLKFIETNASKSIVSVNVNGELHLATIPPSGGEIEVEMFYKRNYSPCKLALCPHSPFVLTSAGWDGDIVICDLRVSSAAVFKKTVIGIRYIVQLHSIAHHPFNPEICISCGDKYVRVFDERNMSKTVHTMCPQIIIDKIDANSTSSSVYSSTGSEILTSYSYEDHYLFNNKVYVPGSFAHRYGGNYSKFCHLRTHYKDNAKFFGPNSEYVISSSEFGSICVWDKNTEEIVDIIGDEVDEDYFEPHPFVPILASWGNDENIRIWAPMNAAISRRRQTMHSDKYSHSVFQKSISSCLLL